MEVYTIGFTKRKAAEFFGALRWANIKPLLPALRATVLFARMSRLVPATFPLIPSLFRKGREKPKSPTHTNANCCKTVSYILDRPEPPLPSLRAGCTERNRRQTTPPEATLSTNRNAIVSSVILSGFTPFSRHGRRTENA